MKGRRIERDGRGSQSSGVLGGVVVLLLLMGCATGAPVGMKLAARGLGYRPAVPDGVAGKQTPPVVTVDSSKVAVLAERTPDFVPERADYKKFIQGEREKLARRPEEERRLEEAVLREMERWLWQQKEAQLGRQHPVEVYLRMKEARQAAEKREAARWAAVEEKLEEYLRWAQGIARNQARQHFRPVGREYLLTESPVWEAAQNELVSATLAWAFRHTQEEDFLRKSPSEVALYLLATRSALAQALVVGSMAPPTVDYTPLRDKTQEEEDDDEVRELAVGLLPGVGEAVDFGALVTGYNVAGRRELTPNERLLCAVGVMLPVVSGKVLGVGGEAVERVALATGRSADEVRAMVRVARQVAPEDAARLERISRMAARAGRLADEDWAFLQRTAKHLDGVLADFHEALKRGEKVPFLAVRTGADGLRMVPGSAEHMAQAWMEYQFRNSRKYPRFRYAPDETWRRMYRTILENKDKGSAFEQAILQKLGHQKNTALMMPPPGSKAQGFIPDAVPGNPNPGELVWGQPYSFVESKAHKNLALTGNLKSMIDYVAEYGGHIELWVRSARHSEGPTQLTKPLQKCWRIWNKLAGHACGTILEESLMPINYLTTYIYLPPGVPPGRIMREFFRLAFEEYRWFKPVRYGVAHLDERLDPDHIDYDALVAFYEERRTITVLARTDRDFFIVFPSRSDYPPYTGNILCETSVVEARKPSWRAAHLKQVHELMRMLDSPLALVGLDEDIERKTRRLVPCADGFGQERMFTVRDYGEGLAGLFWRNFYGPPFVRLFGERLATLPADTRQDLGNDIVLVQPYELPTQAGTPEGAAREREIIAHLGPECFYDHERHLKPTRLPELAR